ncbi:hypothetical protein XELAEV_18016768mg [Xenopus laevis]|uniref:Protein kinase domain-containing protein n=1 Tax=Xenopus laevis TaxID=8355 RepID=A0A974DB68_XENLA|nr:hypothetical protein XELAEV_18016768mg [Xenopus laevis]
MGAGHCSILRPHRHSETGDIKQSFDACEPQVSVSLSGMKQEFVRVIQKEMRIAAGAENLYHAIKDRKSKALMKELRKSSEKRLKALYSSLLKLNEEIARTEAEHVPGEALQLTNYTLQDFNQRGFLGEGGFAKVLLVEHAATKRSYALKILKKEIITTSRGIERILLEKRVAFAVADHPFIVDIHATFQSEYHLFFLMEYVAGGCLKSYLQRKGAFEQPRAMFYAACTLMAISYLHENDIMHRDLSPENLLLDSSGYVKLTDFGLSKDGIGYEGRTRSLKGSFGYMAPEVLAREPYSRSVDWWSLGIVIYEMLVGEKPMLRPSTGLVVPTFLAGDAVNLISGLLQRDPLKRLGSSEEDACDVMHHYFFRRGMQPPFIPEDVRLSEDGDQHLSLTPPSEASLAMEKEIAEAFRNFDYTTM